MTPACREHTGRFSRKGTETQIANPSREFRKGNLLCTPHVQLLPLARSFHAAALRSCSRADTASTAKASVFLREAQGFLKSRRARFQKRRSRNNPMVAAEPRCDSAPLWPVF